MHRAVLLDDVMTLLAPRSGGTYVDGTGGSGGHSRAIAERIGPKGRLLVLDRDAQAVERLHESVSKTFPQCVVVKANFAGIAGVARENGIARVDGVLLDLGVSSDQLDAAGRGFSFMQDGPLDMRMDRAQGVTAAALMNRLTEEEIAEILWMYGDEPKSRGIARRIVNERMRNPLTRTGQLADLVVAAYGGRRGKIHPATRTFQALRIAVNGELDALRQGLEGAAGLLAPGGRLAVISFHSLEDRLVKRFFLEHAGRWESKAEGGRTWICREPEMTILTRKPVTASEEECRENPRARSAKLRVAERKG